MLVYHLLIILDLGISSNLIRGLKQRISETFENIIVKVEFKNIKLIELGVSCWNKNRNQYDANSLIAKIVEDATSDEIANRQSNVTDLEIEGVTPPALPLSLLLTPSDCYDGNLNYVFGLAKYKIGAVVSTFRLENSHEFVTKECIHELGHVFGLKHCKLPCVMAFSNSVLETHEKSSKLCSSCY
ncbi:peptidase zinc-dependent [Gigaspora margarita]|uniref:Peptidase zinc-dependent n=1 Tax=Gigaspora margarita TaxID=4874 RepID=A0A8H3XDC3_GIGMA|nr:peptidase zinc-dependent [Gigaspora margarita]